MLISSIHNLNVIVFISRLLLILYSYQYYKHTLAYNELHDTRSFNQPSTSLPTKYPSISSTLLYASSSAYKGAPLPGTNFAEGGQSSTGSILRWAKSLLGPDLDYAALDDEASRVSPGADGLVALETFQGSRTPITDPRARGALIGLTLSHTRAHIWRALMEAVCLGTRACVEALGEAGHTCGGEIVIAGGSARSDLWLAMHADVTGRDIVRRECDDAPLMGCAVLAAVCAGVYDSVDEAVGCMVREAGRIKPDPVVRDKYDALYKGVYSRIGGAIAPLSKAIADLRGGGGGMGRPVTDDARTNSGREAVVISPSLLASDWSNMASEVQRCLEADLRQLHVDVFDGSFIDSPHALTFGPKMVQAIHRCSSFPSEEEATLDVHLCVDRPARYIRAMAESGANRIIFQWEAMTGEIGSEVDNGGEGRLMEAMTIAKTIIEHGMQCGISINPDTPVYEIYPLLRSGFVDMVDVLAVEPGFGGQGKHLPQSIKISV